MRRKHTVIEPETQTPKPHPEQPPATFQEAVEKEFGIGASYMAEGVMKRFVGNPKPTDPQLPEALQVFEAKRQANLKRLFG